MLLKMISRVSCTTGKLILWIWVIYYIFQKVGSISRRETTYNNALPAMLRFEQTFSMGAGAELRPKAFLWGPTQRLRQHEMLYEILNLNKIGLRIKVNEGRIVRMQG